MKRRTIALVGVAVILCGVLAIAFDYESIFEAIYSPKAPTPEYTKPTSLAQAQRDDLDYLRKYLTLDWSYTPQTRAEANALIDRSLASPMPLTRPAFELLVSRVVAVADNGHSNVWASPRANRLNRLPVRFYPFADGFYVVRALPQAKELLGEKVVAFDGHPFAQVRGTMDRYTGGAIEQRDMRLPFFAESPELLHAAGVADAADRLTLTVEDANGTRRDVTLSALPPNANDPKFWPWEGLAPVVLPHESKDWRPVLAGAANKMLLFADPTHLFFMQPLPARHAYYIRFNANRGTDAEPIDAFTEKAETALLAAKPQIVIVDMRFNGGGDYTMTAAFMRNLPLKLPATKFYLLQGPNTFSAGMTSIAFLKQAGGARTMLVGTWPGDRIRFHSEGNDYCLPYSGICTSARTAIHDYSTKWCEPLNECFLLNLFYPVAIKSFKPDIWAPLTFAALRQGRDPALDAIFGESPNTL